MAHMVHGLGKFLGHHSRCARAGRKWVKRGGTSRGRKRMIVSVVMSRATRVPDMSLLLSTLLRQPTTYRGPLLAFTMTACEENNETQSSSGQALSFVVHSRPQVCLTSKHRAALVRARS